MTVCSPSIDWYCAFDSPILSSEEGSHSDHVRQGAASLALVFIMYCVLQTRDGLLVRPHPAIWRALHGCGVLYLLLLSALVVQREDDAVQFLKMFVPVVGTRGSGVVAHDGDASNCSINFETLKRQVTSMWFFAHVIG